MTLLTHLVSLNEACEKSEHGLGSSWCSRDFP